ncbi:TfoX/Sxy family protein [Methylobacterium iners]|uniref:TfoX/Sxy family protein n=1 Tax=Methylobacterium iners TaxID=418707 RepID=UPI001EE240A6|nr:TfoX/Sxy family protein [Methylobacterium iners]
MATKQTTVDDIVEQAKGAGQVAAKKMFGEYGLYCDGKLVALVCDETLFAKPTEAGRTYLGSVTEVSPYPSAKPYFLVAGERWDDADWLAELIKASAAALPAPTRKRSSERSNKSIS